jgi:guanosine-3',5'-bis(diphosphate) 3'-pyrophosphohydrolase
VEYPAVARAMLFALVAHEGQDRDGEHPLPYATHPFEVLMNLRTIGGVTDEAHLVAAVLHDVVEESAVSFAEIEQKFGSVACSLVRELTRSFPSSDELQGLTKEEAWALKSSKLLAEIAAMSPEAKRIKLADRLANLQEARRVRGAKKLNRYLEQTRKILEIIPLAVSPALWRAVDSEVRAAAGG